jgi:TRAP-type C4-dicarboxylate transport system permease small subunit
MHCLLFSFVLLLQAVQLVWNSVNFEVSYFSIPMAHLQLYYFVAGSFIDLLLASSLWLFMMSRQLGLNDGDQHQEVCRLLKTGSAGRRGLEM